MVVYKDEQSITDSIPVFLITIDTEGDNLWSKPQNIKTKNALFLPRFQELCDKYGLLPTYLTNYEMALSSQFQNFAFDVLDRNVGEIGMHLHAWNSPPIYKLTDNDYKSQPYLIEYPEKIIFEKISYLTGLLEDTFGVKMVSHRAGRWAFNELYYENLIKFGYKIDCSVTPFIYWQGNLGEKGNVNYTKFPNKAYYPDYYNISVEGDSSLLEVPMTIVPSQRPFVNKLKSMFIKSSSMSSMVNYLFPEYIWLRPNGRNLHDMLYILNKAIFENWSYVMFMIHSSELMPSGNPTFRSKQDIEKLYRDLDILFNFASSKFKSMTLNDYYLSKNRIFPKLKDL